jgi:antitoxin component HigA of HigAB toxin-antitoxin module
MNAIKPIRTKNDYNAAFKRIDELIAKNPKEGTAAHDELDVLGTLVSHTRTFMFQSINSDTNQIISVYHRSA